MSAAARDQALRLRVFRFILDTYEAEGRWPSQNETAREFGARGWGAVHHLKALRGADGLPEQTNRRGAQASRSAPGSRRGADVVSVDSAIRDMSRRYNPETYIDVRSWS